MGHLGVKVTVYRIYEICDVRQATSGRPLTIPSTVFPESEPHIVVRSRDECTYWKAAIALRFRTGCATRNENQTYATEYSQSLYPLH